jgi:hypothetical protein
MCSRLFCFVALILMLGVVTPGMGADDPSLMGWWTFDGHARDISGNDRHGTLHGSPQFVPGVFGEALHFEANPDYVTIDGYKGVLGTNPYSIACWVKTTNTAQQQIMHWGTDSDGQRVEFRIQDNRLRISGGGGNVQGNTNITDGEWHHVAAAVIENASASSGDVTFYVDGRDDTLETTNAISWDIVANATFDVTIGMRPTRPDRYFIGSIDEVLLYEKALTPEEILQIIEGGGAEPYPFAYGPSPEDGAMHMDNWVNLAWSAGAKAVSHDVYMGDDADAVNDATRDSEVFRGNQMVTFMVAGFPGNPYPEGLVPGTTYYWRIDEVNDADPNSPWKGDIWTFSIPPRTAYNPDPADGVELVDPNNTALSWTPGFEAMLHTVYFGDDYDQVNNAAGGIPMGAATFNPGPLDREKVYYWRVDEFDAIGTHKGDIWSFTTPGAVGNPQPAYGAVDVGMNTILSWAPSVSASSHELYIGTDEDALRGADIGSPEYKDSKALGAESHDPGLLEADTTYYWRVDGVDGQGNTAKGPIWIFTTGAFILVDDFESYTDDDPNNEAIWQTWRDGYEVPDNGGQVGYLTPPYAEQTIVHGGSQSMPLLYTNEAGVTNSQVMLTLSSTRDWTDEGAGFLSLWLRGASGNAADPVYVAVSNSAGVPAVIANNGPATATLTTWNEWRIPLQTLAHQGISLTDVDKIAIGVGSQSGMATVGGTGTIYVDDIRLYRAGP